ncbi:MAG: thioredoxin fold domain-containing protein [Gammaproteobacteria bacterium]|nr:thioredoxin fold domain-containing protein [Gammaproteobacteria bacterium]
MFLLLVSACANSGERLPAVENLQRLSVKALADNKPIVLLFTAEHCEYCEKLKEEIIYPMLISPESHLSSLVREVDIESQLDMVNFEGSTLTYSTFAKNENVFVTPTVLIYQPGTKEVSQRIVGYNGSDFYISRLETAIQLSKAK